MRIRLLSTETITLTFSIKVNMPQGSYVPDQWIYENDRNNSVRYLLGTKGYNPLICIGINPSTAEPENLDNTLKSVERLSLSNGYDSWIMLNVYPQRATNPDGMHDEADPVIHRKNMAHAAELFENIEKPAVWAAWGTLITKRPYLAGCLADLFSASAGQNCEWLTIGEPTRMGHPRHPLYLKSTLETRPFDIAGYLRRLGRL
jgi:hypothetical protein